VTPPPTSPPDAGSPPPPPDAGTPPPADGGALAYEITDLGQNFGLALDDNGRAAGWVNLASGGHYAAVWTASDGWTALPVLDNSTNEAPAGLDDSGDIALNASFTFERTGYTRGYTLYPLMPVPTSAQPPQQNIVNAMNRTTGHLVGYDEALGGSFLDASGTITAIAARPGSSFENSGASQALALNASDAVVGWMRIGTGPLNETPSHGYLWKGGVLTDLGTGTGKGGTCDLQAVGINDSGLVMGMIDVGENCGVPHLFVYDGAVHDVGCPPGAMLCEPTAIGANGDIVGSFLVSPSSSNQVFLYRGGKFFVLADVVNAPGWFFGEAPAINASGQILVNGTLNGVSRAAILTPK
jgi:hypothetical protein